MTQFIMTFQPCIILIFSTEMQPIYPISKQKCHWISIAFFKPLTRGIMSMRRSYGNTDVRSQDWQQGNATDRWCLHKTNNGLSHIYSLIDLNQTDPSWVLTPAGTSRKPSASYITDQRETRLMPWCRPERRAQSKQQLHNQGSRIIFKLVVDYSNAKFRSKQVRK